MLYQCVGTCLQYRILLLSDVVWNSTAFQTNPAADLVLGIWRHSMTDHHIWLMRRILFLSYLYKAAERRNVDFSNIPLTIYWSMHLLFACKTKSELFSHFSVFLRLLRLISRLPGRASLLFVHGMLARYIWSYFSELSTFFTASWSSVRTICVSWGNETFSVSQFLNFGLIFHEVHVGIICVYCLLIN